MLIQVLAQQPQALGLIVGNTPAWVWGLLAGLSALGMSQMRQRHASLVRVALLPLSMAALSLLGTVSMLQDSERLSSALALWLAAFVCTALCLLKWRPQTPAGTRYDAAQRRFHLPGSATPLLLILAIFFTRYIAAVELSLLPDMARDPGFAFGLAGLCGCYSGIFLARLARLLHLAHPCTPVPATI